MGSFYLSIFLSFYLSIFLSFYLSIFLSCCLAVCSLAVSLSYYLTILQSYYLTILQSLAFSLPCTNDKPRTSITFFTPSIHFILGLPLSLTPFASALHTLFVCRSSFILSM